MHWLTGLAIAFVALSATGFFALRWISAPPAASSVPAFEEADLLKKNSQLEEIRGKRLRVIRIRHPKGDRVPWVVFVHGLGGCAAQFQGQIDFFSRAANILAYDWVGHGQSEMVEDFHAYTTSSLLQDLLTVISTLPPSPPFVLVGHSYGSALVPVACTLLDHQPRAVVLLGAGNPDVPKSTYEKLNRMVKLAPEWLIEAWRNTLERPGGAESASVKRYVSSKASEAVKRKQWAFNEMSRTPVVKRMMAGVDLSGAGEALSCIQPPVLVVAGGEDGVTTPANAARVVEKLEAGKCRGVEGPYVLPDASHNMMLDKEREVCELIRDFLGVQSVGLGEYFAMLT
ncbi:Alpha/Beta hydrolase protein [Hyaloraphidium curvatum]|nr:Alpha/Beta hydrolase protein [Hyaloraphidium curvatum]